MTEVTIDHDVEALMRDGVALRADVYRPESAVDTLPVLLQRMPYDKSLFVELGRMYARAGYVAVMQDVRGQFRSDGVWEPFIHEGADGYDTIEWAATLPGSDGRVGAIGTSYQAASAWQAAVLKPPSLKGMACAVTPADYYDQWVFPSGAFSLSFNTTWLLRNIASSAARRLPAGDVIAEGMTAAYESIAESWYRYLPLREFPPLLPDDGRIAPYFFDWINKHPTRDDYWKQLSLRGRHSQVDVPVLNVEGWYDVFLAGGVENFQSMMATGGTDTAKQQSQLIIGPWGHNAWSEELGEVEFGPSAAKAFPTMVIDWFDKLFKDAHTSRADQVAGDPAVSYFSMGDCTWRSSAAWPPPNTAIVPYLLHSGGHANSAEGDGCLVPELPFAGTPDVFVYDPSNPVPSVGGQGCCYAPQSPIGPYDQRSIEQRSDVLVYTSGVLTTPLEIAGPVTVDLYAASACTDTDFTAKLVDVQPDGRVINLCDGIVRARYRNSLEAAQPLIPGKIEHYTIDLGPTAYVFGSGHRFGLEISSSNFPMYDRNPNTGDDFGQSSRLRTTLQTIHHDPANPSALNLPVQ